MGDELKRFRHLLVMRIATIIVLGLAAMIGIVWLVLDWSTFSSAINFLIITLADLLLLTMVVLALRNIAYQPLDIIATAIGHLQPGSSLIGAPEINRLLIGKRLIAKITERIYKLASGHSDETDIEQQQLDYGRLLELIPAAIVVLTNEGKLKYYNSRTADYIDHRIENPLGLDYGEIFKFSYGGSQTLDEWLTAAKERAITESRSWQRVKHTATDDKVFIFDMAAFYSKDEPHGYEVVLVLLDHTKRYQQDEDEMSFVSLAVHELRIPITVLRGYIEVFETEIGPKLDPELVSFMQKMEVSAAQLSMFINNILNVTRIDNNQLAVRKVKVNWMDFIRDSVTKDLALRAEAYNRVLKLELPDELPPIMIDPVSIYEVLSNLVDNAIKYSFDGGEIIVRTYLKDEHSIETTVQDFGIGIPESVLGNLFEKFYRSHRSKHNVGGTGLGLYLCRTVINSHGGQIWVQSTEKQGSVFGFTLPVGESIEDNSVKDNNDGIERGSHGWIKNHSLYRR